MPPKKTLNLKSRIPSSGSIMQFLPSLSSSSPGSPALSGVSSVDLTSSASSPPPTISTNQKHGKSGKSSYIWDHGTEYVVNGKPRWQCNYCSSNCVSISTTPSRKHLETFHGVVDPRGEDKKDPKQPIFNIRPPIRRDILRKLIVEWIVERRHAFNETQSPALHKIFEYLNPKSADSLKTRNTVKADTDKYFAVAKATIKERLSQARSRIHISYDLWSSPNHKAMIAIVAHWTAEDYKVKAALLAIKEVHGGHTGRNIASVVFPLLKEYDIHYRFGYYVGDNATNNDTSLEWLNFHLREEGLSEFDPKQRRLRCFAHEMQIAVKGLLFGPNVKELEKYPATIGATEEEKREYAKNKWRSFGAVGKLHNVVKYIRCSPQRREAYATISQELENNAQKKLRVPVTDNDTRWGSVMDMVEYALENREHLELYCHVTNELEGDRLTAQDWIDLKAVMSYS